MATGHIAIGAQTGRIPARLQPPYFETQRKKTAAMLDGDGLHDLDRALELATPEELTLLEQPASLPVPRSESFVPPNTVPMNFAGASFSGFTFNFSLFPK